jgi:hypothetical protein
MKRIPGKSCKTMIKKSQKKKMEVYLTIQESAHQMSSSWQFAMAVSH